MGFVDRDQRDGRALQQFERARLQETLGRDVDELQRARGEVVEHVLLLVPALRRIEKRRAYAELRERAHLISHQCDQRGDDDPGTFAEQCGI